MPTPSKRVARQIPKDELTDAIEPDDEPTRPPRYSNEPAEANGDGDEEILHGGWTAAQQTMDSTSDFAQTLKYEDKAVFIKFLEDTPYVSFKRHWVDRSTKDGKTTRAYTCPKSKKTPQDCPLCGIGSRPQAVASFNVALLGDDGQVLLKSWDVGPRLYNVLKGYSGDPKIGPLTRGYFMASKTGKRGTVQHNVSPVGKTTLSEDYDIEVPTQAELDALEKYGPSIVKFSPPKELRELAEELADEYE